MRAGQEGRHAKIRCDAGLTAPRFIMIAALCGSFQACALRPTLQHWGWLEAPPPAPAAQEVTASFKPVPAPAAHRFRISAEQGVFGALMTLQLRDGDTFPDVARHYGLGYEELAAANPGVDPWVPAANSKILIPLRFVPPPVPRKGIVINLAAMRLFHFPAVSGGTEVVTYPVGIGKEGRSTPTGPLSILRKKEHPTWYPTANIRADHRRKGDPLPASVSPGPDNPLGAYAMYLSRPPYLIHGTNKPYSIGWRASNGCIRLYPENIEQLFPEIPVREPVLIVNQPYLLGWQDGRLYLQAYLPQEELSAKLLQKRLRNDLKKIETEKAHAVDWAKVDRAIEEARGIPIPVSANAPAVEQVLGSAHPLEHPRKFLGQPATPSVELGAWQVMVEETPSESMALRLAAFLNHQGPQIPARTEKTGERYRVIAGPYQTAVDAKAAVKRLKIELELGGRVIPPKTELAGAAKLPPASAGAHRERPDGDLPFGLQPGNGVTCRLRRDGAKNC